MSRLTFTKCARADPAASVDQKFLLEGVQETIVRCQPTTKHIMSTITVSGAAPGLADAMRTLLFQGSASFNPLWLVVGVLVIKGIAQLAYLSSNDIKSEADQTSISMDLIQSFALAAVLAMMLQEKLKLTNVVVGILWVYILLILAQASVMFGYTQAP